MRRNETPRERYEDALFALLMEDMLEEEGRKALEENQRLKQDPDAAVPPEMRKRCLRVINQHYNRQSVRRAGRVASRLVSRIAVIILIVAALFATALATNPELQSKAMNFLVELLDDRTVIQFSDKDASSPESIFNSVAFSWIPDEYRLDYDYTDSRRKTMIYSSKGQPNITLLIVNNENYTFALDTEDAVIQNISILDYDAVLIEKDNELQVFWNIPTHGLSIRVVGQKSQESILIQIAENVVIH